MNDNFVKNRILYIAMVVLTIILGLASRILSDQLPIFVSSHFGDALWAAMIYFGLRTFFVKGSLPFAALVALLFCFGIEFSQMYQADWINEIRRTLPGSLILGRGFLPIDLLRYSVGIGISFLLDHYFLKDLLFRPETAKKA